MRNYLLVGLAIVCWAGLARADVPAVVGYDGVLFTCQPADAGCQGYSLDKGTVAVSLWDDAASMDATTHKIWGDTFTVTTEGGYYHVDLGSGKALSSDAFAGPRWMEIQVGSDAALTPRAPVMSVPFAMACGDSVKLQGQPPTAFAQAGHVHVIADVTGLQAALDGKAALLHNHDDLYYQKGGVDTLLGAKADLGSSYTTQQSDDRYYGKSTVDTKLAGKADVGASYTTQQSDAKLDGKAALVHSHDDLYYGKAAVDTKLVGKADAGASYTTQQSDSKYVPAPSPCLAGQVLTRGLADWVCAADANSGGTVTSLSQGTGIILSPNPLSVTGTISIGPHSHSGSDINSGTIPVAQIPNLDASKVTSGTLDNARFSAYADLVAEGKIGTGSTLVAAGNHGHENASWSALRLQNLWYDFDSPSLVQSRTAAWNFGAGNRVMRQTWEYAGDWHRLWNSQFSEDRPWYNLDLSCGDTSPSSLDAAISFSFHQTNPAAGYQELMRIKANGNVGINRSDPPRRLFVNGDAGGTSAWNNDSDERCIGTSMCRNGHGRKYDP